MTDRISVEMKVLHRPDCMRVLIVQALRLHDGIM